jgi:preprotein translocase subunit SecY
MTSTTTGQDDAVASVSGLQDFWRSNMSRRIAITVAALVIYRVASMIPVPGINLAAVTRGFSLTSGHFSSVAIGLTPAFSIYAIFECAKLAFEDLRDWGSETAQRAARRDWTLAVIILALAAFQAYGVAIALSHFSAAATSPEMTLIAEPGQAFIALFVASNVAGTALLLWLASIVTRHGMGSGLWVLYLFPSFATFVSMPAAMIEQIQSGELSSTAPVLVLATVALVSAVVITLTRCWIAALATSAPLEQNRDATASNLHAKSLGIMVWPGFLAAALSGYLTWALTLLFNPAGEPTGLTFGSTQLVAIPVILMVFFTFLFARCYVAKTVVARQSLRGLSFATAFAVAASYVIFEVLASHFAVRLPVSSVAWIAILAILTPLLPRDLTPYLPSPHAEPPVTDADFEPR